MAKKLDLKVFEEALEKAQQELKLELSKIPQVPDLGDDTEGELFEEEADEAEEYSTNLGIKDALKQRLIEVEDALERIKKGTYGKCEKCGMDIEEAVLKAAPESLYCKMHTHE